MNSDHERDPVSDQFSEADERAEPVSYNLLQYLPVSLF